MKYFLLFLQNSVTYAVLTANICTFTWHRKSCWSDFLASVALTGDGGSVLIIAKPPGHALNTNPEGWVSSKHWPQRASEIARHSCLMVPRSFWKRAAADVMSPLLIHPQWGSKHTILANSSDKCATRAWGEGESQNVHLSDIKANTNSHFGVELHHFDFILQN